MFRFSFVYVVASSAFQDHDLRLIPIFATSLVLMVVTTTTSNSCSCIAMNVQERSDLSDAIFTGRVIESHVLKRNGERSEMPPYPGSPDAWARIVVTETFKGVTPDTVYVWTNSESTACGVQFDRDSTYLVYARNHEDLSLGTNICLGTSTVYWAWQDVAWLRKRK